MILSVKVIEDELLNIVWRNLTVDFETVYYLSTFRLVILPHLMLSHILS